LTAVVYMGVCVVSTGRWEEGWYGGWSRDVGGNIQVSFRLQTSWSLFCILHCVMNLLFWLLSPQVTHQLITYMFDLTLIVW